MAIFEDLKAIFEIKKIKSGKVGKLSISQIVNLIINLQDAQKNLDREKYNDLQTLFYKFRKCNTKYPMNAEEYVSCCKKIICMFEKIAPYEKYSGGNEIETSFIMQDFRDSKSIKDSIQNFLEVLVDEHENQSDSEEYIQYIVKNAKELSEINISYKNAKLFQGVLIANQLYGTDIALMYFNWLLQYWVKNNTKTLDETENIIDTISFLCGVLAANKLVTIEESDDIRNKYCDAIIKIQLNMLRSESYKETDEKTQ
ncbi:hypothetical protein [uncultured Subdoligranulum sp.]|uniref:hypothetical protein n=1 Tax=uncultured Subdoligranulum sp. TaxID=512298 RepID=UPI0026112105|nr:hypothetical protein [uncultured Subdoligranulum sp.]